MTQVSLLLRHMDENRVKSAIRAGALARAYMDTG